MTPKQPPRLIRGGLSGRIFIITRYRERPDGVIEISEKFDVTEEFDALAEQRRAWLEDES